MKTAQEMIDFCSARFPDLRMLKNIKKSFVFIGELLEDDECVAFCFPGSSYFTEIGRTATPNACACAVTNKRVIVARRAFLEAYSNAIFLEQLVDIAVNPNWIGGTISFHTSFGGFAVTSSTDNLLGLKTDIYNIIHQYTHTEPDLAPVSSSLDEVRKLKELLDMGPVTQDEFEAKKKKLLNL